MSIKKYTATKDNVISTALKGNLSSSAMISNMGSSDILEIFSIFGQANSASIEKSRVLVEFPIDEISKDRDNNVIPESGSVRFFVRIGNATHGQTTPETYDLSAHPIIRPWDEGHGLDMEEYRDTGPSNWVSRSMGIPWHTTGSDYVNTGLVTYSEIPLHYTQSFSVGNEDVKFDATGLVEDWIKGYKDSDVAASGGLTFNSSVLPDQNSFVRLHTYGGDYRRFLFTHTNDTGSSSDNTVYVMTGSSIAATITNFTASVLTHFAGRMTTAVDGMKVKFTQVTGGFPGNIAISQSLPIAASASMTITNSSNVANGETFVLRDTTNTGHTFTVNTSATTNVNNVIGVSGLAAGSGDAALNAMAAKIAATVVDATSTAYNKITASVSGAEITFTQLTGGSIGTRLNTDSIGGATLLHFFGGFGTNFAAMSSSFSGGRALQNYGMLLKLSGGFEDSSKQRSYYTKKMFSRSSHHFFERPIIEARWDKSIKDDRYYVFRSSSLAPQADNLNTIFLYNKQRNGLVDLPDTGSHLLVQLYPSIGSGISPVTLPVDHSNVSTGAPTYITASRHDKGIYKATFSCANTGSTFYDVWQKSTGNGGSRVYTALVTGSGFTLKDLSAGFYFDDPKYNIKITNLKPAYSVDEKITFRVYMRNKSWQPNVYTVASNTPPVHFFRNGYYRIDRVADNYNVIAYSTGSTPSYSSLSYDVSGSFFNLDMSILEPNYLYQISFLQKDGNNYIEQKEKFKFRVDP